MISSSINPYSYDNFIWDWSFPDISYVNDPTDSNYVNDPADSNSSIDISNSSSSCEDEIIQIVKETLNKTKTPSKIKHTPQKVKSTPLNSGILKKTTSKSLKTGRTVKPARLNLAPSTAWDENLDLNQLIQDHASLRIQLMYMRLLAVHNLGIRSDGSLSDIKVSIGHTNYQYGQGSKEKGTQAAHASAIAGCADNIRETCQEQNINEHELTPKKIQLLTAKHFPQEALQKLQDPTASAHEIKQIYNAYWPREYAHESVLSGTELDRKLNATNELESHVNQRCDKPLEAKIRPQARTLVTEVIHGSLSPEEGTKKYHEMITNHFNTIIPILENKIKLLEAYLNGLEEVKTCNKKKPKRLVKTLKEMSESERLIIKKHEGVAKTCLKENRKFLSKSLNTLEIPSASTTHAFKKWFSGKYDLLKEEASTKLNDLKTLLNYNIQEKEGTLLPPFELFSGNYNPVMQHFSPLSPRRTEERQYSMLEADQVKKRLW